MQTYYLKNGTRESGPYLLDDLKYQRINNTTMVKVEGGQWQLIAQVKDLRFLLQLDQSGNNSYSTEKSQHNHDSSSSHVSDEQNQMVQNSHSKTKSEYKRNPSTTNYSDQQFPDAAQQAKKRVAVSIAFAIFLAALGMAISFFMASQ